MAKRTMKSMKMMKAVRTMRTMKDRSGTSYAEQNRKLRAEVKKARRLLKQVAYWKRQAELERDAKIEFGMECMKLTGY